jgi:hypothetical protein
MSRISTALVKIYSHPLIVIEVIIAVGLLVSGLYAMGPWYQVSATTPIGKAIESTAIRTTIMSFYVISAGTSLWGAIGLRNQDNSIGLFLMCMSYCFMTLLRWLAIGLVPLTWIFSLTLALITAFLYFRIRLLK